MSGIGHNGPPVTVKRTALDEIEAIVDFEALSH